MNINTKDPEITLTWKNSFKKSYNQITISKYNQQELPNNNKIQSTRTTKYQQNAINKNYQITTKCNQQELPNNNKIQWTRTTKYQQNTINKNYQITTKCNEQ